MKGLTFYKRNDFYETQNELTWAKKYLFAEKNITEANYHVVNTPTNTLNKQRYYKVF